MGKRSILLGHGSGGALTHDLIKNLFLKKFNNPVLNELSDSAFIKYRESLAFTTDSFVVSPLFFPGGDIGKLSVCGTINDLLMLGARPEYISLGLIIEEGLDLKILEKIIDSISQTAEREGVIVATGDLKVVEKGAADKIFINTSGIGRIIKNRRLSAKNISPNDKVILTSGIGRHGLAILAKRNELDLGFKIKSDCAALSRLLIPLLKKGWGIKFMRDPTRGGVATTLNEVAQSAHLGIEIWEDKIPLSQQVRVACELLGLDPLYIANEGCALIVVEDNAAEKILALLKKQKSGRSARIIGSIVNGHKGEVVLHTSFGTQRIVDMLLAEPLPRIC
ncbi:MAG: hydrogenase expression/formation protein HypE [Candidatus Omnitrophota bacterium]|jgi:hydrogenase expression/formation protein HypE